MPSPPSRPTIRQRWRRWRASSRYRTEQDSVWTYLKRQPDRKFVRTVFQTRATIQYLGTGAIPVIAPIQTATDYFEGLLAALGVGGIAMVQGSSLLAAEEQLENLLLETNWIDACIDHHGLRLMFQPRLTEPPLPPVPDWDTTGWDEVKML